MVNKVFWKDKRVFITGHTGFKGSWLTLWLTMLGAEITGYALEPPTNPSLYRLCNLDNDINSIIGDIRDKEKLKKALLESKPEIIIHMAAQPLVRESYSNPVETYETNVMGIVYLLEAIRQCASVRAVVNVTTDKCYENKEWVWGYRENEPLGGFDPYSNSKACSELVTSSFRNSFFPPENYKAHGVAMATARSGNVIGGGDWAKDRLIPDCLRSLIKGEQIIIRNPNSIRPWQHVLEPLSGYLLLAEKLYQEGTKFGEAWNFGPDDSDAKTVKWIVEKICNKWGTDASYLIDRTEHPHEAQYLKLDCSKANIQLGWKQKWKLEEAISKIVNWTQHYCNEKDVKDICKKQIIEGGWMT